MTDSWSILTEAAWRAAALGFGAGTLLLVWRRRSPATTQGVWIAIVLGMLALPALTVLAPRLTLAVPLNVPGQAAGRALEPDAEATPAAIPTRTAAIPVSEAIPVQDPSVDRRPQRWGWPQYLTGIYLGGALLMLLFMARGLWTIRSLARSAREVDDPGLRAFAAELLPGRGVEIASSPAVHVPITAGFLPPRVFLPESWRDWSDDKRHAVLAHELSHVRRGDFLWIVLAELNKCLYWFHPLAWIARHRLAAFAERASDADAAARVGSRTAYARVLVEIAALVHGGAPGRVTQGLSTHRLVAVPMASSCELSQRVEDVLRGTGRPGPSRWARIAGAGALVLLVATAGTVELVAQPVADPLVAELSDPDPERRARAAADLGLDEARWDEAIPHLAALLGDDARIRRNVWRAGRRVRWVPARSVWDHPSPGETATIVLASMSQRAAPALVGALDHGDAVARRNAAWGLGELRHPRGIPEYGVDILVAALDDPDATVRAAVAWALGEVRVRRATERLIDALLNDRNADVRAEAAAALGEIRAADAADALARVARASRNPKVRGAARHALREVREHGY